MPKKIQLRDAQWIAEKTEYDFTAPVVSAYSLTWSEDIMIEIGEKEEFYPFVGAYLSADAADELADVLRREAAHVRRQQEVKEEDS